MSKGNSQDWENENKIGFMEIFCYSIAVLILTLVVNGIGNVLSWLFYCRIPTLETQLSYSVLFYVLCFLINIPILLTTKIPKEK